MKHTTELEASKQEYEAELSSKLEAQKASMDASSNVLQVLRQGYHQCWRKPINLTQKRESYKTK